MKIVKRIFLILLVLLILAQIPFIYRRYQTGKLAERIAQLEAQRTTNTDPNFKEYKGIIHAHTSLGGHSTGTFEDLIAAAFNDASNKVDAESKARMGAATAGMPIPPGMKMPF